MDSVSQTSPESTHFIMSTLLKSPSLLWPLTDRMHCFNMRTTRPCAMGLWVPCPAHPLPLCSGYPGLLPVPLKTLGTLPVSGPLHMLFLECCSLFPSSLPASSTHTLISSNPLCSSQQKSHSPETPPLAPGPGQISQYSRDGAYIFMRLF